MNVPEEESDAEHKCVKAPRIVPAVPLVPAACTPVMAAPAAFVCNNWAQARSLTVAGLVVFVAEVPAIKLPVTFHFFYQNAPTAFLIIPSTVAYQASDSTAGMCKSFLNSTYRSSIHHPRRFIRWRTRLHVASISLRPHSLRLVQGRSRFIVRSPWH